MHPQRNPFDDESDLSESDLAVKQWLYMWKHTEAWL